MCIQIDSFLVVIPRNSLPEAAFTVTTPTQLSSIVAELCRAGVVSLSCGGLKIKHLICCSSQSPGEIEKREVSWTFTKKLDSHLRVLARSREGRWCWTLKLAQKRSCAVMWSWAAKAGLLLLRLFLNSIATDIVRVTAVHSS